MTWPTHVRKVVYTLNVGNYAPLITELTFPLLRYYARKIGADFHVITTRKFPAWPVAVEKLQIFTLARKAHAEWAIFFDADTLVHPETVDYTAHLPKDTVAHNGSDPAGLRWRPHPYFQRDGRWIGSCNWCAMASEWCLDFWHPPTDLDLGWVLEQIYPTVQELNSGQIDPAHLVDDYLMSRNVARYGLKFTTLIDLMPKIGLPDSNFLWHTYQLSYDEKLRRMQEVLWGSPDRPRPDGTKDLGWNLPPAILPR